MFLHSLLAVQRSAISSAHANRKDFRITLFAGAEADDASKSATISLSGMRCSKGPDRQDPKIPVEGGWKEMYCVGIRTCMVRGQSPTWTLLSSHKSVGIPKTSSPVSMDFAFGASKAILIGQRALLTWGPPIKIVPIDSSLLRCRKPRNIAQRKPKLGARRQSHSTRVWNKQQARKEKYVLTCYYCLTVQELGALSS